jgi:hypothetical protein
MTFNDFLEQLVKVSLEARNAKVRDSALNLYIDVSRAIFDDPVEDAEKLIELFENTV